MRPPQHGQGCERAVGSSASAAFIRGLCLGSRHVEQLASLRDVGGTGSVGEQAVVTDAMEAAGQHVDEEASGSREEVGRTYGGDNCWISHPGNVSDYIRCVSHLAKRQWRRTMGYRWAGFVFSMLLGLLFLGPFQTAQAQTNSAWRWGMWDINDPGQKRKAPQAVAQEINGRGRALMLSKCEGAWLTFVYSPEKSFVDEVPQYPIPPAFKAVVLRWDDSNEAAISEIHPDGWRFDLDVMDRDGRFRSLLKANSFALCPSKEIDIAECRQFSGVNFNEAVAFVCKRR